MSELRCLRWRELAGELALGVPDGREPGDALDEHLNHCTRCQDFVAAVAGLAARLVELLPEAEPPPDFDRRVLRKLAPLLAVRRQA